MHWNTGQWGRSTSQSPSRQTATGSESLPQRAPCCVTWLWLLEALPCPSVIFGITVIELKFEEWDGKALGAHAYLVQGLDLISVGLKGLDPGQREEKKGERAMEPGCGVETTKIIQGRNHATGKRVPCLSLCTRWRARIDSSFSHHCHSREAYSLSYPSDSCTRLCTEWVQTEYQLHR